MTAQKPTLVRSKLLVPSTAGLLHRPRVVQVIEQGLERKLTLISAPAGYGKTSALVDFARHCSVPVCWYTADEQERDLGTFVAYLVGAIQERFPGFGKRTHATLASLTGDLFRDPAALVGELVNEMLEVDSPFVLVIDNYEALDGAFGIRTFIHRLLQVLPPNCHLMIGSRALPAVPVTQLVAKRQLVGLTDRDLRFTPEEIRELLRLSQIEASEVQVETLAVQSEGWVTGVLLLADLLRDKAEAALLGAAGTGVKLNAPNAYDYLAREVLEHQPPDIRHFLRVSAVLREMSFHLCREILQIKEPRALLAEVERRNLFVTRFGKGGAAAYRYHNLFRDFLHEQLRQQDPALYADLHRRAAEHFERDDDIEEAVYHYLTAEAWPEAIALMEQVAREWFTRGRVETILRWAEALPEEARVQAPRLALYESRVLTDRYDYAGARRALVYTEAGLAARPDMAPLLDRIHDQRAAIALFEGRYEDAIREAQVALDLMGQDAEPARRAGAQRLIGRACIGLGHFAEGIVQLQEALALSRQSSSPYDVVNLLQDLTLAFTTQGQLNNAAACLNEALAIAQRLGAPKLLAGVLNNLAWLHHTRGEYREALALYEEALSAARGADDSQLQVYTSVGMADLYRDMGAYERAAPLYEAGWQIAQESEPGLAFYILVAQADMHRWQGDYPGALGLLAEARRLAEQRGLEFEREGALPVAEGITRAESGEIEVGLRLLSEGAAFLEQRQARRELARARFLLARAHWSAGHRPQAIVELRQALALAQEVGTWQFTAVEGQHVSDLLEFGITEGVSGCHDLIARIQQMRAFREEQEQAGEEVTQRAGSRLEIYALGEGRVVRDGRVVSPSEWQAAMAKELFFYILLHGPLERDAIGAVFWPDLPAKTVIESFHTTLYRMRRALGADAVILEEGRYRLGDVDYWFDVEEFEALIERARLLPPDDWRAEDLWRRAVALYRGDFLPEVERVWCVPKREALREMYVEALIRIGQCHEARKEFEGAIDWYRRALAVDELREDVHRRIMHCYAKAGRRPEALAQYERCRAVLRGELGIEPEIETKKLAERIAAS